MGAEHNERFSQVATAEHFDGPQAVCALVLQVAQGDIDRPGTLEQLNGRHDIGNGGHLFTPDLPEHLGGNKPLERVFFDDQNTNR